MRVMLPILVMGAAILASFAGMFLVWYMWQGFVPWRGEWWVWLVKATVQQRGMPDGMLGSGLVTCLLVAVSGITLAIWHQQPSARTLKGGVVPDQVHGAARWANWEDIEGAGLLAHDGVTVGACEKEPLRHDGPEHVLAFAPTRSGKGVSLVLPTLLEWMHSAVVLDIKGENYALTAGYRESIGTRVLKFEPTALEGSVKFNPLAEIRLGTDYELMDCQNIAAMIIDPDGKGLRDFWMQSGFEWLSAAILHVLYRVGVEDRRCATLADVNRILSAVEFDESSDRLEGLLEVMIAFEHGRESVDEEVSRVASKMYGRAREERSGVHSSSLTQLSLYADPIIARNIAASDFTLDDLMNGKKPVSLYIIIPPSDIDRLRPLIRVIFNIMLRKLTAGMEFEDGKSVKAFRHRLLLMLDEFTSVGKLDIFEKTLAFMAGYGIKCYVICQDLTQLQQAYGREESIMSNCHVRIAFAPNKVETAKTLSEIIGKQTIIQTKRSRSGSRVSPSVSDSLYETGRELMRPDEIMNLPGAKKNAAGEVVKPGEMLILVAGFPAIRGEQRLYFKDKTLLERAKMPAPGTPKAIPIVKPKPGYCDVLKRKIGDAGAAVGEFRASREKRHEPAA